LPCREFITPESFLRRSFRAAFSFGSGDDRMYFRIDPAMSSFSGASSPPPTAPPVVFLGGASRGGKRAESVDSLALFRREGGMSGFFVTSKSWDGWSTDDWLLTFLTLYLCCGRPEEVVEVDLYE
jgi:hypothetical protein